MRTYLTRLLAGLLLFAGQANAQEYTWNITWTTVEKDLGLRSQWGALGIRLHQLLKDAEKDRDAIATARALYSINRLHDNLYEDTLFFYHSRYQDSIIQSPRADTLLKVIMLHLKAKRIDVFRQKYAGRAKAALFRSFTPGEDYASMNNHQLDSLTDTYFARAISLARYLANPDIRRLAWICTDPYSLLFKPTVADLIFLDRARHKVESSTVVRTDQLPEEWTQVSIEEFISRHWIDSAYGTIYKAWMDFRKADPAACAFLDLQFRRMVFNQLKSQNSQVFEAYLLQQTKQPYPLVQASAVYQLCMLWTAGRAIERFAPVAGKDRNRQYAKAVDLYKANKSLLDSFAVLDVGLTNMLSELTTTYYSVQAKSRLLSYQPNLATLEYRNISRMHVRFVRLSSKEPRYGGDFGLPDSLLKRASVKDTIIELPDLRDYQLHSAYIKFPALEPGRYVCLFSMHPIDASHTVEVRAVTVDATSITAVPMYGRLYVLHSNNGFPVSGARVKVIYENDVRKWIEWHTVNKEGWVPIRNNDADTVQIVYKGDTLMIYSGLEYSKTYSEVYVKDEYDYKAEYYEEHLDMSLFTDRSIYRPGQQVFFKGIVLTRDPKTGERVILNWGNLKLPFYQKWLARAIQKFGNKKIELVVNDAFGKPFDTLRVWPNKYGSFTGSFTIPKDAPTGEWEFDTEWFEINRVGKSFKVEEYKKPTMFLEIAQPSKMLKPGDSIPVIVKVRSFTGADLDGVKVDVQIRSRGSFPDEGIDTTIVSKKGLVKLFITDTAARALRADSLYGSVYYSIDASALNEEGETVEEESRIDVSNRPVEIVDRLMNVMDAAARPALRFGVKTPDGSKAGTRIDVRITAETGKTQSSYPDTWLYTMTELEPLTGKIDTSSVPKLPGQEWFRRLAIDESDSGLLATLPAGDYSMQVTCWDGQEIIGQKQRKFTLYNGETGAIPNRQDFKFYAKNAFMPGQEVKGLYGSQRDSAYVVYASGRMQRAKNTIAPMVHYDHRLEQQGLQRYTFAMPKAGKGNVEVFRFEVHQGEVTMLRQTIYAPSDEDIPEIIVEKYRQKLAPGAKETFLVRIKTKDYNKATELLTAMYDASLDKLEEHRWDYPQYSNHWYLPGMYASEDRNTQGRFSMAGQVSSTASRPVWWSGFIDPIFEYTYKDIQYALQGKAAGIFIGNSSSQLNEVVVTGFGTMRKKDMTGSVAVVSVRGFASLKGSNAPLIVIDGVPYTGDLSALDSKDFADIAVLKGADATAIYGSRGSDGVILVSTSGKVQIPQTVQALAPEIPPVVRKNFQETAFFFPQLHAERKGLYTLEFTMPENVTTWKWMMLAHTMGAEFGYAEKTITSQLPVMVQPAMPRFLYQGDQITLKSRITNLDTLKAEGTLKIRIEDAVTGKDLTSICTGASATRISVAEGSNSSGAFQLTVPKDQLNPLKLVVSYSTPTYADGEEHILPILTNQFFFTATQSVPLRSGKQEIKLMKKDDAMKPLGIGFFIEPVPRASMMYALPGLVNYPWNCAEQTFSKIYGYAVANHLMRMDTSLARSWSRSVVSEEKPLPIELSENSIPWASLGNKTKAEQKALYTVFDTVLSYEKTNELLAHLEDMQKTDGGMPWFKGGKADRYIMTYLVKNIGKMREQGISLMKREQQVRLDQILEKMIRYLDASLKDRENRGYLWNIVDARGYHLDRYPADSVLRKLADSLLRGHSPAINRSLATEAEWVIMMRHWYPEGSAFAPAISHKLESIRQEAVSDEKNGLRWKALADDEDLSASHEETVALLAEAFAHSPMEDEVHRGVIKWLLQTRKDHGWGSTKATAHVVGLLGKYAKEQESPVAVDVDGLKISNSLFAGDLSAYREGNTYPASVKLEASSPATLGINYYYISSVPPVDVQQDLTLGRSLSYFDDSLKQWRLVEEKTILRVGQRVRVELEIFTSKLLQYVTIQDRRAATFDLPGMSSGYEWTGDFGYYQSVRDASLQFFAEKIPAGRSRLSYEMVVSKEGSFSHGHAVLSCMYKPEKIAYSTTLHVVVRGD